MMPLYGKASHDFCDRQGILLKHSRRGRVLRREHFDGVGCILLDVKMPGLSGMDLQEELNKADYHMPIVFVTGHGDIPMTVEAMKKRGGRFSDETL